MTERHKMIAFFITIGMALLGCINAVEEASKDITPPEVLSVYATDQPAANLAAFPIRSTLTIEFSEAIASGTLSTGDASSTVRLSFAADETIVLGRVELRDETHAIFTPDAVPYMSTDYVFTIAGPEDPSGGIKDLAGNALGQRFIFTFKTCGPLCSGTRQYGVSSEVTFGRSVATDPSGNVFVAGETYGGLDGNMLIGYRDFFVTKYSTDGLKQ